MKFCRFSPLSGADMWDTIILLSLPLMNTSFRKRLTVTAYLLLLMSFPALEGLAAPSARYYTYDFSAAEGLSSNIVYSIIKGKDNNMWIATRQGIDRYDGFSFRHYSLFNDDLRLVGDGRKIQISYDGQNRLWAYTDAGQIFYYDVESDRFRPYLCTSDLGLSPLLNTVTQIRDKLYVCTMDGIYCFDVGSSRLISTGMKGNDVKCLKSYVTDRLIAGGSSGLYGKSD